MQLSRRSVVVGGIAALPILMMYSRRVLAAESSSQALTVHTTSGPVRGAMEDGVAVFRGIPYAAPPSGNRRFRPPEPVANWKKVRDATEFGPIVPQNPSRLAAVMGDFHLPQAEDNCLTLNIWTPAVGGPPAPVLIWIHGGGFTSGSGRLAWYSGLRFAQHGGIVVVTINYRVGPLGFLYLPGIADGNMGILDQRMALRWIKDNVARFGGDPSNITVAGQSGGGRSSAYAMAAPETSTLFKRGIMQSPAVGSPPATLDVAAERTRKYLDLLKIDDPKDILQAPVEKLLEGYRPLLRTAAFNVVRDGKVFTGDPVDALVAGAGAEKDILVGVTRDDSAAALSLDEQAVGATDAYVRQRFEAVFGDAADRYMDEFRRIRQTRYSMLVLLGTENSYLRRSLDIAEARGKRGGSTYVFRFDWPSRNKLWGACHTLELPFVFNNFENWPDSPMLAGADRDEMATLSSVMHQAWINFIRTGNPNHEGMPPWARYDTQSRITMRFDNVVEPVGDLAGLSWRLPWPRRST